MGLGLGVGLGLRLRFGFGLGFGLTAAAGERVAVRGARAAEVALRVAVVQEERQAALGGDRELRVEGEALHGRRAEEESVVVQPTLG